MEFIVLTLKLFDSAKKLIKMPYFALKMCIKASNLLNSIVRWPQKRNRNKPNRYFHQRLWFLTKIIEFSGKALN